MAKKRYNIEIHGEEVKEIMQEIPGRFIRWGLAIIFLIFLSVLVMSYFFEFKDKITVPAAITMSLPPVEVNSPFSITIKECLVEDQQMVKTGDTLLRFSFKDKKAGDLEPLEVFMNQLEDINIQKNIEQINFPINLSLGELQDNYQHLYKSYLDLKYHLRESYHAKEISLLKEQLQKKEDYNSILKKRSDNATKVLENEMAVTELKQTLLKIEDTHEKEFGPYLGNYYYAFQTLKANLSSYKSKVILSPINGKVIFKRPLENSVQLHKNDQLMTLIPDNNTFNCNIMVSPADIGKVKYGQEVQISLIGYSKMDYGVLLGKINAVGLKPSEQGFKADVELDNGLVTNYNHPIDVFYNLNGTAEIVIKEERMLYRFIQPLKMILND